MDIFGEEDIIQPTTERIMENIKKLDNRRYNIKIIKVSSRR
jgi:sulfatase maturation enzyme AslB (radical SAM superfamily)